MKIMEKIYVFNGEGSILPNALFSEYELAENWIKKYSLTGLLTAYPLNIGVYEWAIEHSNFKVKHEYQKSAGFIQKFTWGDLEHYHFENGECVS